MTDASPSSTTALIALGGNLGDVQKTFVRAIQMLCDRTQGTELRLSRLYRTQPVGVADSDVPAPAEGGAAVQPRAGTASATVPPFMNAALTLRVDCPPQSLLAEMQQIEAALGRTRDVRWGPRTVDLDLIGFGKIVLDEPNLTLPHPACWYRRFVLDPLRDVAADWRHPLLGETVIRLRERMLKRPLRVGVDATSNDRQTEVEAFVKTVQQRFDQCAIVIQEGVPLEPDESTNDLTFNWRAPSVEVTASRAVSLADAPNPAELAVHVLQAALDQPVPC